MYQRSVSLNYIAQALDGHVVSHVPTGLADLQTQLHVVFSWYYIQMGGVAPAYISMSTFNRLHQLPKAHLKQCIVVLQNPPKASCEMSRNVSVELCQRSVMSSTQTNSCTPSLLAIMSHIPCLGNAACATANNSTIVLAKHRAKHAK
ncbi:TPA: hypothetical protein ACH3X2_002091 [Trebouxia sp. C0005]